MSSPSSPLSSYSSSSSSSSSSSEASDAALPAHHHIRAPSSSPGADSPPHSPIMSSHHHGHHGDGFSDVSSDTSGSVPGSPGVENHEDDHTEQVTVCRWDGCDKDMGNMDDLVKHIHEEHIGTRKATYACQWDDCTRKGMAHASGYALRAHMRSHTKEKPFYCSLPECDRSFTRSDALAKHMRTVHETEALRPSDPIPKSHPNHPQNHAQPHNKSSNTSLKRQRGTHDDGGFYDFDDGFDKDEEKLPPKELLRLLRQKKAWAEQEQEELKETLEMLDRRRRENWIKKELLLNRVLVQELGDDEARKVGLDFNV